jgi:hypothetical protein
MKMGSPMILTHEQDIAKPAKNMRLNTFTAMKEILILEMKPFIVSNPNQEKRSSSQVLQNSISDAAQVYQY